MIQSVQPPAHRAAFAAAIQGVPCLHALLGRDLALWADNPGAPVRLFLAETAALALSGSTATLCGSLSADGWEELRSFLRFTGTQVLRSTTPAPWGTAATPLTCYGLAAGERLFLPPAPAGLTPDDAPPIGEVARFLFSEHPAQQDAFYSATCSAAARGMARCWALRDAAGALVCTVQADALHDGEACLAMGRTSPALRGQGIGGWHIASCANALAAQGWRVSFLCYPERCRFYDRLGFRQIDTFNEYQIDGNTR